MRRGGGWSFRYVTVHISLFFYRFLRYIFIDFVRLLMCVVPCVYIFYINFALLQCMQTIKVVIKEIYGFMAFNYLNMKILSQNKCNWLECDQLSQIIFGNWNNEIFFIHFFVDFFCSLFFSLWYRRISIASMSFPIF